MWWWMGYECLLYNVYSTMGTMMMKEIHAMVSTNTLKSNTVVAILVNDISNDLLIQIISQTLINSTNKFIYFHFYFVKDNWRQLFVIYKINDGF